MSTSWRRGRYAKDIEDYQLLAGRRQARSLARLVIVIDEFAAMSRELPDFISGLVNIAQRGRSLGIHLILATQRPSGVISQDIRANANLRIALRVTDPAESADVIGVPDAASISQSTPGRAYVRLGHASVVPFQAGPVVGGRRVVPGRQLSQDHGWRASWAGPASASPSFSPGRFKGTPGRGDHRPERSSSGKSRRPPGSCASRARTVRGWHHSRRACSCVTS